MSLPLAALILTDDEGVVAGSPARTLLPIAGQTLIEYQVRIARACGAGHIVVLVDRIPALLVAAFDRLRADGIEVDIARDAREVADRIHPEERLLLVADGIVASRSIVEIFAKMTASTLLTVPDVPQNSHFERIDATDRWGGIALLDGKLLRDTAAMLGDWTLGPTLLRAALQAGAKRHACKDEGLALVQNEHDAQSAAHALTMGNRGGDDGFWQSHCVRPIVSWLLPFIIGRNIAGDIFTFLSPCLLAFALLSAAMGWLWLAFALFLLCEFPAMAARILKETGAQPDKVLRMVAMAGKPVLVALLLLTGWSLNASGGGWGPIVLALWAGIALFLQPRPNKPRAWFADAHLIALEMLVATAAGQAVPGLMLAVAHAVVTQFWLVRRPT